MALDNTETWAVSELTRDRFQRLAENGRALVVGDETRGTAVHSGVRERESETVVDYAVAAWADAEAGRALFDAVRADAAVRGGDTTRVLVPETPRHVSGAALARAPPGDSPVYVFAADLTADD